MKKRYLLLLGLVLFLYGCPIADEIFLPSKEKPASLSLQERSELAVTTRIKSQLENESYEPYGFSAIKIIKPKAIIELEQLEEKLKQTPKDSALYKEVQKKQDDIREKNIESKITIDHIFSLTKDSNQTTLLEVEYLLGDTLAVQKIKPKIQLKLPIIYHSILPYYFNEYTIFATDSYAEGRKLSRAFFRFYKTKLETFNEIDEKSAFLKHALSMSLYVKQIGKFDHDYIKKNLFDQYLSDNYSTISDYKPLNYSALYETRKEGDNSLVGYYFFHEFIRTFNAETDTNVVVVEMNPYYQIHNVSQLDKPFETYTNQ